MKTITKQMLLDEKRRLLKRLGYGQTSQPGEGIHTAQETASLEGSLRTVRKFLEMIG